MELEIVYATEKLETQCTSLKAAKKLFGGDNKLAARLLSRINALEQASTLKDIVVQPPFHFHALTKKGHKDLRGRFAIDVGSHKCPWRIILRPLNEDGEPFDPCNIDEIAASVEIVNITEVSRHYE